LGLFATLSVFFVQMVSLRYVSVLVAAIILTFRPAFTAMFAILLDGENITMLQIFGGLLLLSATIIYHYFSAKREVVVENS